MSIVRQINIDACDHGLGDGCRRCIGLFGNGTVCGHECRYRRGANRHVSLHDARPAGFNQ